MIQEEKQLLLKDLCARLPYGVRALYKGEIKEIQYIEPLYNEVKLLDYTTYTIPIYEVKPYLRPMSSMTEEERNEYLDVKMQECERVALAEVYRPEAISIVFDWLNGHHFDYRGLIKKGLAIKAPEGMYKTK